MAANLLNCNDILARLQGLCDCGSHHMKAFSAVLIRELQDFRAIQRDCGGAWPGKVERCLRGNSADCEVGAKVMGRDLIVLAADRRLKSRSERGRIVLRPDELLVKRCGFNEMECSRIVGWIEISRRLRAIASLAIG